MENKVLEMEYDSIFDSEEKLINLLKIEKGSFTKTTQIIKLNEVGLSDPALEGRKDTRIGLTKSVSELGVVYPIVVMTTEAFNIPEEDLPKDIQVKKYMIVDGVRRTFAALKNNITEVESIVLDFKDKEKGRQIALALGLVLSKTQRRTWQETWDLLQILEKQSNFIISPGTLESLLALEPGDSMKLKDVMLSDDEEAIGELISNKKSLMQCYNLLQKHRKEIDQLEKEDMTGISEVEGADAIVDTESKPLLTNEEVTELLQIDDGSFNIDEMSFDELDRTNEVKGVEVQKSGERHPVDKAIKQATLHRDKFTCQCCGKGKDNPSWLGVLVYHHKVPVSAGGPDTEENGLTLCANCHLTLHIYVEGDLIKPDFENLPEEEALTLKKIMHYGNIAIKAYKMRDMSRQQIKKVDFASRRHLMPGEGLKDNKEAYSNSKVGV